MNSEKKAVKENKFYPIASRNDFFWLGLANVQSILF